MSAVVAGFLVIGAALPVLPLHVNRDLGLQAKGITPCIPGRKSRNKTIKFDKRRYKRRNRIEIMFGRLKDWRRVATRYDRCSMAFFSAIALAATVIFWL